MADFNPRTRIGCDFLLTFFLPIWLYFNPRTRIGCDFLYIATFFLIEYFNPRTRIGCDSSPQQVSNTNSSDHSFREPPNMMYFYPLHFTVISRKPMCGFMREPPRVFMFTSGSRKIYYIITHPSGSFSQKFF